MKRTLFCLQDHTWWHVEFISPTAQLNIYSCVLTVHHIGSNLQRSYLALCAQFNALGTREAPIELHGHKPRFRLQHLHRPVNRKKSRRVQHRGHTTTARAIGRESNITCGDCFCDRAYRSPVIHEIGGRVRVSIQSKPPPSETSLGTKTRRPVQGTPDSSAGRFHRHTWPVGSCFGEHNLDTLPCGEWGCSRIHHVCRCRSDESEKTYVEDIVVNNSVAAKQGLKWEYFYQVCYSQVPHARLSWHNVDLITRILLGGSHGNITFWISGRGQKRL